MEAGQSSRILGKRKPLGDCTNTIARSSQLSSSTSVVKPANPSVFSAFKRLLKDTGSTPQAKTGLNAGSVSVNRETDVATNPSSASVLPPASTPLQSRKFSSVSGDGDPKVFEPCSVYTRRQAASKRKSRTKAIKEPMSCPLVERTSRSRTKVNLPRNTSGSKSCKVPEKKKQKMPKKDVFKHSLPQDFIEQQRAYFAEIDAYELPEEEVTSADELD